MAGLSDFLEEKLLQASLGLSGGYVFPRTLRVTAVDDTATYTVTVNGIAYSYAAVGGDLEPEIRNGLATALAGAPVTLTSFTDLSGDPALRISQDGTDTAIDITVSVTGTGSLGVTQDVYTALFLTDPSDDNTGTEVPSANGYTRVLTAWNPVTVGTTTESQNSTVLTFGPAAGGNWGTVTWVALFDAPTGGNLLYSAPLSTSKTISDGDSLQFAANLLIARMS